MSNDELIRLSAPVPITRKPSGLGRGLGALMGEVRREEPLVLAAESGSRSGPNSAAGGFALIATAEIEPHPDQPRRHFDEAALDELPPRSPGVG